jgi:hypothetical protein
MKLHWMTLTTLLGAWASSTAAQSPPKVESAAEPAQTAVAPPPLPLEATPPVDRRSAAAVQPEQDDLGPPTLLQSVGHVGGYGGLTVAYSRVAGAGGALVGGEGGVLIQHRLSFGGAGYGWTRDTRGPADIDGVPRDLQVGYGGLLVRYSVLTGSPVYASVGALVGGGALVLQRDSENDRGGAGRRDATDAFFVFEPQLSVQANLLRWMRVGFQVGYRLTSGLGRLGYTESDLDAFTVGGTLQFGRL